VPTANWSVISHGGHIIDDIIIIHINTYIKVSSQPVRHTCSLYYGQTYTYMLPSISISIYYFHAFYFKRCNSFSLKLLSVNGMLIFMNTLWRIIRNKILLIDSRKQANQLYNRRTSMENYS